MKIKKKLLLTPKDFKPSFKEWKVEGSLNPVGIRLPDKKILLYVRIAESQGDKQKLGITCPVILSEKQHKFHYQHIDDSKILQKKDGMVLLKDGTCRLTTISHFRSVILDESGFNVEYINQVPIFAGKPHESEYGVEDPRITKLNNNYFMTYVGVSLHEGVSTFLAKSKDLKKWKRLGLIFREQNKDAVLFSEKINNRYVALNRPESLFDFSKPGIWISYSKDLIYWGRDKHLIRPRRNSWGPDRIGAGSVPLKTKKGWLLIYHGVKNVDGKNTYSAGAALLDLKNPEKIIARSPMKKPLFKPSSKYEKKGFMNNVVFPTAAIMDTNKKDLLIYSGAADSNVTVRKINLEDIFNHMHEYKIHDYHS